MKDKDSTNVETTEKMADNPLPFKLERELTLMPNEFRERLSASHLRSRKSAAHRRERRSANTQSTRSRHRVKRDTMRSDHGVLNSTMYGSAHHENHHSDSQIMHGCAHYEKHSDSWSNKTHNDEMDSHTSHISFENDQNGSLHLPLSEMGGTSSHSSERLYSVQTPVDLHLRDLMAPLEEWGSQEVIREKKYTVLPSINKPSVGLAQTNISKASHSSVASQSNDLSIVNQLDYGREKMEEEADFFADFRINTSHVHATPRQNPLPPIKHGDDGHGVQNHFSRPFHVNKPHSSGSSKRREKLLL